MSIWLNELTHERVLEKPNLGEMHWVRTDENDVFVNRQKDPPAKVTLLWKKVPTWTELDACDSAWHSPTTHERLAEAAKACPYCGMSAAVDLATRRKADPTKLSLLTDEEAERPKKNGEA